MIVLIEALKYKCLKYVRRELGRFQVLVGPNASGKSTFLDVIDFIGDLLNEGPEYAVAERASDPRRADELVWNREGSRLELAIEMSIPEKISSSAKQHRLCRYEVAVGNDEENPRTRVLAETLLLLPKGEGPQPSQRTLFPMEPHPPQTILFGTGKIPPGWTTVVKKIEDSGNDYFKSETGKWNMQFRFGPYKTALANVPEDPDKFPVATWAKRFLMEGIQPVVLDSWQIGQPSERRSGQTLWSNGSNLASVVQRLQRRFPKRFESWVEHAGTVLRDLKTIRVRERPQDRHVYLTLVNNQGLRVPSWLVSDGTRRLLALTVLAYIQPEDAVYLIEEPENGIHPQAVQTVFQSLSSAYGAQVLVATHSPVFLRLAEPDQVLCFTRTSSGATDMVSGAEHPKLKDWKGGVALADLFVAGVLG